VAEGGEWSASRPGRFTLNEKASVPTTHDLSWSPHKLWTLFRRDSPAGDLVTVASDLCFKDMDLLRCDTQSVCEWLPTA